MEDLMCATELFSFGPFPTLTTERLILRELVDDDAAAVFVWWGDPEVQKYNAEPLRDVSQAHTFIAEMLAEYAAQKQVMWAITMRAGGAVLGGVDLHDWNRTHHRAEVGYSLARAWWGQGIASEAVRAVLRFGFGRMQLHRIEAGTIADNWRSVRMLERLGFRREGTRRERSLEWDGTYHDSAMYGLLESEAGLLESEAGLLEHEAGL
jgi:RimJ/RimL family protein N-acetyltransferase